jgi:hypothetical protein
MKASREVILDRCGMVESVQLESTLEVADGPVGLGLKATHQGGVYRARMLVQPQGKCLLG